MPALAAADEKVDQERVTLCVGAKPGSICELPGVAVNESPKVSLPVDCCKIKAPAALNVLCPETYSGNGGVTTIASWYGKKFAPSGIVMVPLPGPPQHTNGWPAFW